MALSKLDIQNRKLEQIKAKVEDAPILGIYKITFITYFVNRYLTKKIKVPTTNSGLFWC